MTTEYKTFSFDGCGINDTDEYRSRLATLTEHGKERNVGRLLAAAPDLLDQLKECYKWFLAANLDKEPGGREAAMKFSYAIHSATNPK